MAAIASKAGPLLKQAGPLLKQAGPLLQQFMGKMSPMDLFNNLFTSDQFFSLNFKFKQEITDVFKKVKSKTCEITNSKDFQDTVSNSVIENIKKSFNPVKNENEENDENEGENGGNVFYEELYDILFTLLIKHDNPDLHLFIIEKYKSLIDFVEQIEENKKVTNNVKKGNDKEKEYLESFIENVCVINDIFIEILMKNEKFTKALVKNPEFLKMVVENPNPLSIGNDFIENFVKYSKNADKLEIKKFVEELNKNYYEKLDEIKNLENLGGAGSSKFMDFVSKNASTVGKLMPKNMKDLNIKKFANRFIDKETQAKITQNATDAIINKIKPTQEDSTKPTQEDTKTENNNSIVPDLKNKGVELITNSLSSNPTAAAETTTQDTSVPQIELPGQDIPYVETSSDYFSLVKIKSEIRDTFVKIKEKICDIIGRKEFHDHLQESIFNEIENHIHNSAPKLETKNQEIHNLFFYKLYHILFKITPRKEEQNYQLLETHCREILSHLKENRMFFKESESEHPNMKQEEKTLLTSQYEWVNQFIEGVIINEDSNLFMNKLLENERICSLIFQQPLFFEIILKKDTEQTDVNNFSTNLVNLWLLPEIIDESTKVISDKETEEEKEAEQEEGVLESVQRDSDIVNEKQKTFEKFLRNLSQQLSREIGVLGNIQMGGDEGDGDGDGSGSGDNKVCSDKILDMLKIPIKNLKDENNMINSVKKSILNSTIGKQYQAFLFENFQLLSSNDAKNLYEKTIGKQIDEIYKETQYFKQNKFNPESNEDTFVYHLTKKENRSELIKYIYNVPNRKGFSILMVFLLTENKLKNNRLFMFRKLFEKMSPQDMRLFLSLIKGELDCGGKKGGAIEDISEEDKLLIQIASGLLTELVKEKEEEEKDEEGEKEKYEEKEEEKDEEGEEEEVKSPAIKEEIPLVSGISKTDNCEKLNDIVIPECMDKKTYRKLALIVHPDKNSTNCTKIATEKMKILNDNNKECKENKNEETEQTLPENEETEERPMTTITEGPFELKSKTEQAKETPTPFETISSKEEKQCTEHMNGLLKNIQKPTPGSPFENEILQKLITHSISEESIETLFQQEVLDKIRFPRNEIENTIKRFMAMLLSPGQNSASDHTEIEIEKKTKIINRVLLELSNYEARHVILSVFEQLSKAPDISKTIYPRLMKVFYDEYDNHGKMKMKINELINTIRINGNNIEKKQIVNQLCNQKQPQQGGKRKTYRKRFRGQKL